EIYFPQNSRIEIGSIEIDEAASFSYSPDKKIRWITYGSSNTQCAGSASPAQTWPALVARHRNWDLTCLGYSGECHMESMVARMIRDMPAEVISLCLGINVYGSNSLSD